MDIAALTYRASTNAALLAVHIFSEFKRLVTFFTILSKYGSLKIHSLPAGLSAYIKKQNKKTKTIFNILDREKSLQLLEEKEHFEIFASNKYICCKCIE